MGKIADITNAKKAVIDSLRKDSKTVIHSVLYSRTFKES